jgi:peptidyl-tRNA hydrolase
MVLVTRRGAIASLGRAAELAGAAAVRCVREHADDPWLGRWRARPGKVVLRARGGQWDEALALEGAVVVGEPAGECVIALPPRPRDARPEVLDRLQAMASELEPPPDGLDARPPSPALVYAVNPRFAMSSGKTLAQVAHAAVAAAEHRPGWAAAGCPAVTIAPSPARFDALARDRRLVARIQDAGLTEVPPGTVTVLAIDPS